jgi:DNA-binding IclR family transcriptional regulator
MAGMTATMPEELRALLGELISDVGERVYLRSEAGSSRRKHDISVISAPVYDHHRRQTMVVSLRIGRALTDAEIARHAKGVMATAHTLTNALGGH